MVIVAVFVPHEWHDYSRMRELMGVAVGQVIKRSRAQGRIVREQWELSSYVEEDGSPCLLGP